MYRDTGADVDVKENVQNISAKIAPFLRAMIDSGEYDECDYGMVIDVFQLLPEDYRKYIDPSVCEIYYFITSDVTSEEEKRKDCEEIVAISKYYKEQCEKNRLPYYETAQNREKVFADFIGCIEA